MSLPEMTPELSRARIMNTTVPIDFEHVQAEETKRQRMLSGLRVWSLATFGHRIVTQQRRREFRNVYSSLQVQEVA